MTGSPMRWWSPWLTLWWVAVLFVVGSACFALGALPVYVDLVGPQAAGVTFFVGSLFFTSAAALQALDSGPSSDRATRVAGLVQLAGTLLFNVSTSRQVLRAVAQALRAVYPVM